MHAARCHKDLQKTVQCIYYICYVYSKILKFVVNTNPECWYRTAKPWGIHSSLRWRHAVWKCSIKKQARRAHGCAACVCHASLHTVGAHSCAACVSLFVSPFRQQDSKTLAAVLLPRALDRWLLVACDVTALRACGKMLRPNRAWTLDPQVTVNSPVGVMNDSTCHETDNTIECWNQCSTGLKRKVCNCVTSTGLGRKWPGGTQLRWVNTSSKALRGKERDEKRVEESQEDVHRNEGHWKEITRGEKSLEELTSGYTICDKRSDVPERSMEVCRRKKKILLVP